MDVDPIDGGPRDVSRPTPMTGSTMTPLPAASNPTPMHISEEEEVRHSIEMLRGDDVSARVAAANRLETIASALGVDRTRDVSRSQNPCRDALVQKFTLFTNDLLLPLL
jgi:hypothetical protein